MDVVSENILKYLRDVISLILAKLINICIQVGIFSNLFDVAKVIPLHTVVELC